MAPKTEMSSQGAGGTHQPVALLPQEVEILHCLKGPWNHILFVSLVTSALNSARFQRSRKVTEEALGPNSKKDKSLCMGHEKKS